MTAILLLEDFLTPTHLTRVKGFLEADLVDILGNIAAAGQILVHHSHSLELDHGSLFDPLTELFVVEARHHRIVFTILV